MVLTGSYRLCQTASSASQWPRCRRSGAAYPAFYHPAEWCCQERKVNRFCEFGHCSRNSFHGACYSLPLKRRASFLLRLSGRALASGMPLSAFENRGLLSTGGERSSYRVCASAKGPRRLPHSTIFNTFTLEGRLRVSTSPGPTILLCEAIRLALTRTLPPPISFCASERDLVWRAYQSHLSIRI